MSKLPIPFDNPATYEGHSGVDYPQPRGTVFRASGPGTVTTLGRNARGGFYIWVQYDDSGLVGYHHMDSHDGCPDPWTRVDEGTRLGYVGNTGNSTGPHLHSEVSGAATTDGYWRFFDSERVVGQGQPSGGGSAPFSRSSIPERNSDMEFISITNLGEVKKGGLSGNEDAGCAVLNTSLPNHANNPIYIRVSDPNYQETADGYARSFGRNANEVKRQDWVNLLEANRLMHLHG